MKNQAPGSHRGPLQGEKFKTVGEVKAYLSGEKIQCFPYGEVCKMLGAP
jgi:hypothetical protein